MNEGNIKVIRVGGLVEMNVEQIINDHDVHFTREIGIARNLYHEELVEVYLKYDNGIWKGCNKYAESDYKKIKLGELAEELYMYYGILKDELTIHEILCTEPRELERIRDGRTS